jgi:predicted PurR-regulated permease PerM
MEPNLATALQQALRIGLGAGQSVPDLLLDPRQAQATLTRLLGQDWAGLLQDWEQRGTQAERTIQSLWEQMGGSSSPTTVDIVAIPVTTAPFLLDLQPLIAELKALSQDLKQLP